MKNLIIVFLCMAFLFVGCDTAKKGGEALINTGKATVDGAVTAGKAAGKAGATVGKTVAKPFTDDEDDEDD